VKRKKRDARDHVRGENTRGNRGEKKGVANLQKEMVLNWPENCPATGGPEGERHQRTCNLKPPNSRQGKEKTGHQEKRIPSRGKKIKRYWERRSTLGRKL